jgi:hypothetical protein
MKFFKVPIFGVLWLLTSGSAFAGMTTVTLTDIASARIDALSFFLFTYLLISWFVKLIWNQLAKTFSSLPRLKYREALGVVFVSGLLFYVVLTMISGARELLTPGAWEKQGNGYRLRGEEVEPMSKSERRDALELLKDGIWEYAKSNEGKAPSGPFSGDLEDKLWEFGDGGMYALVPDVKVGAGREVMVYEPASAGARRFVLLADGSIEDWAEGNLKRELDKKLDR